MSRPRGRWEFWLVLIVPALIWLADAGPVARVTEDDATVAIATLLGVERNLLVEDRQQFDAVSRRRNAALARLGELHTRLDAAVAREDREARNVLRRVLGELGQARAELAGMQEQERSLAERIRERLHRTVLLEEQLAALRGRHPAQAGALSGSWEIVLLPNEQRGTLHLDQSGAIVTGTYTLAGGFTGSLHGTLVQNKLYLQRIDSRLGRSMELEGRLSSDRQQLRGTWHNLELADGEGASGHWSAKRRSDEP